MKLILISATSICGITDLKERRIPNIITYPLLLYSLIYNIYIGNFKIAIIGFTLAFVVGFIGLCLNNLGAGDVKLMSAIGMSLGTTLMIEIMFVAAILGLMWGLLFSIYKAIKTKSLKKKFTSLFYKVLSFNVLWKEYIKDFLLRKNKTHIPFGFFIALAVIIVYL